MDETKKATTCRCNEISELVGPEADIYAMSHLEKIGTSDAGWTAEYICPVTLQKWILDRVHGERQGGGWSRLHKVM
jgi:hypothetical protein